MRRACRSGRSNVIVCPKRHDAPVILRTKELLVNIIVLKMKIYTHNKSLRRTCRAHPKALIVTRGRFVESYVPSRSLIGDEEFTMRIRLVARYERAVVGCYVSRS